MQALCSSHKVRNLATIAIWLTLSFAAGAQDELAYDPIAARALLDEIQMNVSAEDVDSKYLTDSRAIAIAEQANAENCEAEATAERARLDARMVPFENIFDAADVDPTVFDEYLDVKNRLDNTVLRQTLCGNIDDQANKLVIRITSIQNAISQQFLSSRGETIFSAIRNAPRRIAATPELIRNAVKLELLSNLH